MKEHKDELLENVTHLSHRYNELLQLMQTTQKMIEDEATMSIENIHQWYDTHVKNLHENKEKIVKSIEKAKQDAKVTSN